ncbi:MAG: threonine synthase, partial [Thermoanaerobaculia bacterium]
MPFSFLTQLSCTKCGAREDVRELINVCTRAGCGGALFAEYAAAALSKDDTTGRPRTIWRWHELMPARRPEEIVSLGEGGTPLLHAKRLGEKNAMPRLYVKEEAGNPT